jgi:hypothetical protein
MEFKIVNLSSNRAFGQVFSAIFGIACFICYLSDRSDFGLFFLAASLTFLSLAYTRPQVLQPINRLWAYLGLCLNFIVSPIILGSIFFGIFMPVGIVMRFCGRDELGLQVRDLPTYWKLREPSSGPICLFHKQF